MNLKNKVVVITGAGSGIGRALARGFSDDQTLVMGFGRTREHLEETKRLCDETMDFQVGDVQSEEEVSALFKNTAEHFGPVDILINNAGIKLTTTSFIEGDFSDWERVIDINLKGVALCCKMALPYMLDKNYGRIVNLTSRRAEAARPDASYSVSKAALSIFTRALSWEMQRQEGVNILVNDLIPGPVQTPMNPKGGQKPEDIYPHVRTLATLPSEGPTGQVFFKGEPYPLFANVPQKKTGFRQWVDGIFGK